MIYHYLSIQNIKYLPRHLQRHRSQMAPPPDAAIPSGLAPDGCMYKSEWLNQVYSVRYIYI